MVIYTFPHFLPFLYAIIHYLLTEGSWGVKVVDIVFYCTVFIAPLHLVVDDVLHSLSDLLDFMFLVCIYHKSGYAICCLNVSIWIAYVGRGRCSSYSMMVESIGVYWVCMWSDVLILYVGSMDGRLL